MTFDRETESGYRNRLIGLALLGLIAVGVVLGLLVGGLGLVAVRTADVGSDDPQVADARPEPSPAATESTTRPSPAPAEQPRDRASHDNDRAVLRASPQRVGIFEEIDLSGRIPEIGAGVPLQVQRRLGGPWADFPVNPVTGTDGRFNTFVQTGRAGQNEFRLLDPTSGAVTPSAAVDVG